MKDSNLKDTTVASFPIVGIGASAGGLYALECFLTALPVEFGFALVFVQHLSTEHKSMLTDLLHSSRPDIDVLEIVDDLEIRPGRIYLCPPGKDVAIRHGVFQMVMPPKGRPHLPVDEFFASLAKMEGERAIGVIFSGSGTDGFRGVQAIRSQGGAVFVQDPATAEFAAMPLAAIATGQVDGVLPAEDIAREILKLCAPAALPTLAGHLAPDEFKHLFRLLHEKTGNSFTHYKKNVVARRVRRRMYLRSLVSVPDYLRVIAEEDGEAADLAADLMIGVTSFFRDPLAWKALRIETVRKLASAGGDSPIRVWTPACATGEEAYSIAMLLADELDRTERKREFQVFATDVSERALEKAREGKYPASIIADVGPDYMRKFFTCSEDNTSLVIGKGIRDRLVFARQNLLTDPPFSRLDLIICRNLLIYLEPAAQEKCLALFHYALREGGYLFLGNAESTGRNSTLFRSLARKKCRIYQKIVGTAAGRPTLAVPFAAERTRPPAPAGQSPAEHRRTTGVTGFVQEKLLEEYTPPAVAIDLNYEIIYHNGPTARYLRQPRGAPTKNLLELLPANLGNLVRAAIFRAAEEGKPVSLRASIPGDEGRKKQVTFRFSKLRQNLFLLVFRDKDALPAQACAVPLDAATVDETALRQLENELEASRAELRSHIEQLKGLNEELQSSNEELQAANEELETSREEMQSLNEELITVNTQLQSKIEEQDETNNDLNNFLTSTSIPTFFLDRQLRVRRFTPAMSKFLQLLPADVGRSINDMSQASLGPNLIPDTRAVLDHLGPVKREILIESDWYIRTILPYKTTDNRIRGVVITYNDISELKKAEEHTNHLASFPRINPNPVIEVDSSGKITFFNSGSQEILEHLGVNKENIDLFLPADLRDILQQLKKKKEAAFYREVSIKERTFGATVHLVPRFDVVRLYAFDITERKRAENVLQARLRMLAAAYTGSISVDKVLQMTLDEIEGQTGSSIGFYHYLEADQETLSLQNWSTNTIQTMCAAEGKGQHYNISRAGVWVDCVRERRPVIHNDYASLPHRRGMPAGHAPVVREMVIPIIRGDRIVAIIGLGNKPTDYNTTDVEIASLLGDFSWEIIERKQAEEALRRSEEQLRRAQEIAHLGSWELDLVHNVLTWSNEAYRIFGFKPQEFGASYEAFLEAVHPDDRKAVDEAYSGSVREDRDSYEIEHRITRKSTGEVRVVHEKCEHFRDETGRIVRSAGMVHDITERKGYEEALLKAKQEWERTFDSVPDLIAILDPQYQILRANRAMAERLGTTSEQCLGLNCFTCVHGTAGPPASCPHTLSLKDGKQHVAEVYEERLDGYFLVTTTPLFDDEGKILGTVHVARDITERKRTEEEVKKLNQDLNNSVIQLEAANRELEAFSSSVSHDLRAPLRTISGFSQALLEDYAGKLDEEGRDSLERIIAGTHRMGQLIDDLLNLSRITRTKMKRKRMNLSEMAANIAATIEKNEPDRQVDWMIAADVFAEGDGQLLLLVLDNLLRNAFKFTAKKQEARIEFGVTTRDGERIYFVRDNGAGLDMSYGGKLFHPFQRLHTMRDFPGTGIGLATVKRIINRHGGRTWIEGEPEKGAVVYFTLGEQIGEQSA